MTSPFKQAYSFRKIYCVRVIFVNSVILASKYLNNFTSSFCLAVPLIKLSTTYSKVSKEDANFS
jgi:hypothetical protein